MFRIVLRLSGFQVRHHYHRKGVGAGLQLRPTVAIIRQLYGGKLEVDLTPPQGIAELTRSPRIIVIGQHRKAGDQEVVSVKQTMIP